MEYTNYFEAKEHFKNKRLFLKKWLHTSDMNVAITEDECHSLHGLIDRTGEKGYRVPESWPEVTIHDKNKWKIYNYDDSQKKSKKIAQKEKYPKGNKFKSRQQSLTEINRQWLDKNSNFVVWEKMPMYTNIRNRNGEMGQHKRSQSVPPENRVFYSRIYNQKEEAKQKVLDMYKSKDDLDKPPPSCFPIQCCAQSKTDFYSLASVNNENNRGRLLSNENHDISDGAIPRYYPCSQKGSEIMPNVVPSLERTVPGLNTPRINSVSHGYPRVMPDLVSSMNQPRSSRSRSASRVGSASSHAPQHLQYSEPLSSPVHRPFYMPSALQRAPASKTPSTIHKVPAQALTPLQHKPKYEGYSNAHLPGVRPGKSRINLDDFSYPQFPPPIDQDTYSIAGTTFTVYNIEPSGMFPAGYDSELQTSVSKHQNAPGKPDFAGSRIHAGGKPQNLKPQGKCMLKFGKKANHGTKEPGYFSCPRKVDTLATGEYIVLDTENQTLQVFSAKGLCEKVYQFKLNILDMRVWSSTCIALLYQNQVGLFDIESFKLEEKVLQDVQNPRVMDKMKDKTTGEKLFVIGTMSKVTVCNSNGKTVNVIGVSEDLENPTFKRINAVTVDRRNNDIYVLDSDYKTIFAFSHLGEFKSKLDTNLCDLGPVFNPLGMSMSREGQIFIADTFNHRVLHASQQGLHGLIQYSVDYYPNQVKITSDGRLLVAINSEGRTFAGVRVYDFRNMTMSF